MDFDNAIKTPMKTKKQDHLVPTMVAEYATSRCAASPRNQLHTVMGHVYELTRHCGAVGTHNVLARLESEEAGLYTLDALRQVLQESGMVDWIDDHGNWILCKRAQFNGAWRLTAKALAVLSDGVHERELAEAIQNAIAINAKKQQCKDAVSPPIEVLLRLFGRARWISRAQDGRLRMTCQPLRCMVSNAEAAVAKILCQLGGVAARQEVLRELPFGVSDAAALTVLQQAPFVRRMELYRGIRMLLGVAPGREDLQRAISAAQETEARRIRAFRANRFSAVRRPHAKRSIRQLTEETVDAPSEIVDGCLVNPGPEPSEPGR